MSRIGYLAVMSLCLSAGVLRAADPPKPAGWIPTTRPGWTNCADPADPKYRVAGQPRVNVPIRRSFQLAAPNRPSPFVAIGDRDYGSGDTWSLIDLRAASVTASFKGKIAGSDQVLSPDGRYLASHDTKVVQIWAFKGGKSVEIPAPERGFSPDIVGFAGPDEIILMDRSGRAGKLQVYSATEGKLLREIELASGTSVDRTRISPGGRFLAVCADKIIDIVDLQSGNKTNTLPIPPPPGQAEDRYFSATCQAMAFSADGNELALLLDNRLLILEMSTGQALSDCPTEARGGYRAGMEVIPGSLNIRLERKILDRNTGKVIYEIPQQSDKDFYCIISEDAVVGCGTRSNAAIIATLALPKAQIQKAAAAVRAGNKVSDAELPPLTAANLDGAQPLFVTAGPEAWSVKPNPASRPSKQTIQPIALRKIAPGGGVGAARPQIEPHSVIFGGQSLAQAVISYHVIDPTNGGVARSPSGRNVTKTIIDRASPGSGSLLGTLEVAGDCEAIDLSGDGKYLLVRNGGDRLDVWEVPANKHLVGMRPYEGKNVRNVRFGAILDAEHLLTSSDEGILVLWKLPECKAVYALNLPSGSTPVLSPGRQQLAIADANGASLLDPRTGRVVASLQPPNGGGELAFSADGTRLAVVQQSTCPYVMVWDLSSGKMISDFPVPTGGNTYFAGGGATWCGNKHLLVRREILVDVEHGAALWRYQAPSLGMAGVIGQPDDRFWFIVPAEGVQPPALYGLALPHPGAEKAAALAVKGDDMMAVKPGTKVKVEAGGLDPQAIEAIKRHVQDAGLELADDATIRVVCTTTQKETRSETYGQGIMGTGQQTTVSATVWENKVALIGPDGQALWGTSTLSGGALPGTIFLRPGESAQDQVNKMNQNNAVGYFVSVRFPRYVPKAGALSVGYSRLSLRGAVAADPPK